MKLIDRMVEYFIRLNKRMKRWHRAVSVLAAVVVFATTYALVLPAITLDKDTASTQAGIEIGESENESDVSGTVYEEEPEETEAEENSEQEDSEETPEDANSDEDSSSDSGQKDAEAAVADGTEDSSEGSADSEDQSGQDQAGQDQSDPSDSDAEASEEADLSDTASAASTVAAIAATTGQPAEEIKLITEPTQLMYEGSDYIVYADFGESAMLPEGVTLDVREITKESDPEAYEEYYNKALSEMQDKYDENTVLSFARFYDITFKYQDAAIEPSGDVKVRIEYKSAVEVQKDTNVDAVHFDKEEENEEEEKAVVIDSEKEGTETSVEAVEFESDKFSVYGVVGTELSTQFLSSNGNTYEVTVTYGSDANIPKDSSLKVTEFARDSEEYAKAKEALIEYKKQSCEDLNVNAFGVELLDISIVDKDGNEIEPEASVDVNIKMKSLPEDAPAALFSTTAEVHHFVDNGEGTDIVTLADTASVTGGTITVSETDATAEFKVDSFSHFTITWGDSESATVYFVDQNGEEITTNATLGTIAATNDGSKTVDLSKYAVNSYTFENVQIVNAGETYPGGFTIGNKLTSTLDENGKTIWQYTYEVANVGEDPETFTANVENGQKIYAIYGYGNSLTTVDTVDSRSMGFHMYMTNYASAAAIGSGYYGDNPKGATHQGCYSNTTAADGYPTTTKGNKSLSQWFTTNNEVTNLFLASEYNETGYFYYNSAENFAELHGNSFTVYNQLGTPSSSTNFFYRRGNFMPYNTLKVSEIRNRNLYSDSGAALPNSDPRYNEAIYGFKQANDFYFGMYATADFFQPVDGKVNGDDMIYEFTGDDDMVVYIDGTLVLDLGGIHDAQKGYINFNTGEVGYTVTPLSDSGNPDKYWRYTSIYDQFAKAGTLDKTKWDGNTFADGTEHTFQMFYMERGAGASNLKIKVNIPPIPDGSVTVTKNLEGLDATQAATEEFTVQLLTKAEGESEFTAVNQAEYTLSDVLGKTYRTDAEGKFKLKPGQSAFFSGIPAGTEIQVVEPDTGRIYEVSYTATNASGEIIEGNETTIPGAGHVAVVVKNDAENNSKAVTINKVFINNGVEASAAPVSTEFQNAEYMLQESEDNGDTWTDLHTVTYSSFTDQSYTFSNLDPRKVYRVIESITDDTDGGNDTIPYSSTTYEVGTITAGGTKSGTGTTSSTIVLEKDSAFIDNKVTFTNVYQNSVAFKKLDEGNNVLGGAKFTLYKEDGTTVYTYSDGETQKSASGMVSDKDDGDFTPEKTDGIAFTLPAGTYYLVETEAPDGYIKLTERIKITVADDCTVSAVKEGSTVSQNLVKFDPDTKTFVITVHNTKGVTLPNSGGAGTFIYTLGGVLLILISAFMYGFRMRRRERRFR